MAHGTVDQIQDLGRGNQAPHSHFSIYRPLRFHSLNFFPYHPRSAEDTFGWLKQP